MVGIHTIYIMPTQMVPAEGLSVLGAGNGFWTNMKFSDLFSYYAAQLHRYRIIDSNLA